MSSMRRTAGRWLLAFATAAVALPVLSAQPPISILPEGAPRVPGLPANTRPDGPPAAASDSPRSDGRTAGTSAGQPSPPPPASSASADATNPDAVPRLDRRVTDLTGTLPANRIQQLDAKLAALEKDKGAQIAVLMVPTTGDRAIEQYAVQVFDAWKLGRQGVDDGILLVVAKNDRALRIEVGYGLEGAVTDAQASRIIRDTITPRFAQGDFAGGIEAGVDRLAALVRGEDLPAPAAARTNAANAMHELPGGVLMAAGLILLSLPIWLAALVGAFVAFIVTGSVPLVVVGAFVGTLISLVGRMVRPGTYSASRRGRSRGGWAGGMAGGLGGLGGAMRRGGGGGSSVFRGGGGRSGGGGASGRW